MSLQRQTKAQKDAARVCKIKDIRLPRSFEHELLRSISRNEKSIVARQLPKLAQAVAHQGHALDRLDASPLFEAACHKRGAGMSTILLDAGLRAHTSSALSLALQAMDAMGLPLPLPQADGSGKWAYKSETGKLHPLEEDSGLWLQALASRRHLDIDTARPEPPSTRAPRF